MKREGAKEAGFGMELAWHKTPKGPMLSGLLHHLSPDKSAEEKLAFLQPLRDLQPIRVSCLTLPSQHLMLNNTHASQGEAAVADMQNG